MSPEFWWGLLALPIAVLATAIAGYILLAVWTALEAWAERRHGKIAPVRLPEPMSVPGVWTDGNLGHRGAWAANLFAGRTGRYIRIGPIVLMGLWGQADQDTIRIAHRALIKAFTEAAEEDAGTAPTGR